MPHGARETVSPQASRQCRLMLEQLRICSAPRKGGGEIQMQARRNAVLPGNIGGTFRIFHKHHGADCGHAAIENAFQGAVGSVTVAAPIVRVHHQ